MTLTDFFYIWRSAGRWRGSLASTGKERSGCWPLSGYGSTSFSDFWRPGEMGAVAWCLAGRRQASGWPGAAEVGCSIEFFKSNFPGQSTPHSQSILEFLRRDAGHFERTPQSAKGNLPVHGDDATAPAFPPYLRASARLSAGKVLPFQRGRVCSPGNGIPSAGRRRGRQ